MIKPDILARLVDGGIMSPNEAIRSHNNPTRKKRSFTAAQTTRLTESWTNTPKPADVDIKAGLKSLVARSRDQAQNGDYMKRFLSLCKTNIIGANGIILRPRSLDNNNTLDKDANEAISNAWDRWGKYGSPDVTGTYSWRMIQRQAVENLMRDGEILIIEQFGWKGNPFNYGLQFIDSQALPVDYDRKLNNGNVIKMGVEFNEWRKPVAYHIEITAALKDSYSHSGRFFQRIPAEFVIHRFLPEYAWQSRGIPAVTTALLRMNMLKGYEEAELMASRVASSKMGFFVDSADGGKYVGDGEQDAEGNYITDAEPATFERLPAGVDFREWNPTHPTTAYKDFVKATLRGISSGLGVNYNSLSNDLEGVNYNSLRQGAIDERAIWMQLQDWMIETFTGPIYESWLKMALLSGEIKIYGTAKLRAENIEKYMRVEWQGRRWPWVDPAKEMKANVDSIDNRLKSISEVIREQGRDPDAVWKELAEDFEKLKALGLTPAAVLEVEATLNDAAGGNDGEED